MHCVSKQRVEEACQSCCNDGWLNGDAVHMLVEQAIVACGGVAHVVPPGSSTHLFSSNSVVWKGCCSSGDTLPHIESQLSKQVVIIIMYNHVVLPSGVLPSAVVLSG